MLLWKIPHKEGGLLSFVHPQSCFKGLVLLEKVAPGVVSSTLPVSGWHSEACTTYVRRSTNNKSVSFGVKSGRVKGSTRSSFYVQISGKREECKVRRGRCAKCWLLATVSMQRRLGVHPKSPKSRQRVWAAVPLTLLMCSETNITQNYPHRHIPFYGFKKTNKQTNPKTTVNLKCDTGRAAFKSSESQMSDIKTVKSW